MKVFYAVWHHRHGEDVLINKTAKGRLKNVCLTAILPYSDELSDGKVTQEIDRLIKKGDYSKAIELWGTEQSEGRGREEWLDFSETKVGE